MLAEATETRFNDLFHKYVPGMGKAETLAGEILRAVAKIGYRYYNDGDIAWQGYGRETVNPAVRFLQSVCESENLTEAFVEVVEMLFDGEFTGEDGYEYLIDSLADEAVHVVEFCKLGERKNEYGDMLDYRDPQEDVDRDEEDDFDYDEWERERFGSYDEDDEDYDEE